MITKITPKQEALIPKYIEKWVDLASKPIIRNKLKKIFKKIYGKDKTIIIGESFQNTIDLIRVATEGKKLEYDSQLRSQLHSQLYSQLGSQLVSQLYSQLGSQLHSQLVSQLHSQLYSQLGSQLVSQLHSQLYSQLGSQLVSQLGSQLHSQLVSQLHSQLYSQLYSQLHSQLDSQLDSQLYSQLHSQLVSQLDSQLVSQNIKYSSYISYYLYDWAGYYDYAEKIGVEFDKSSIKQYFEILENIPIVIFVGDVIFVCEKPQCSWSNGLLHSDTKPAISWQDGTGFYHLNGVNFDEKLWKRVTSFREDRNMPFEEILKIVDIDQRTQAMRYGNIDNFLTHAKAVLLDESKRGNSLYMIPQGEIFTENAYYLRYSCPSTGKVYMSGVPKEVGEKKNADEAQAWKHWLSLSAYQMLEPANEG